MRSLFNLAAGAGAAYLVWSGVATGWAMWLAIAFAVSMVVGTLVEVFRIGR